MQMAFRYWSRYGGDAVVQQYNPELAGTFYVSKLYRNDDAANVYLLGQWDEPASVPV
jgi:hypothetical protein